MRQIPEYLLPYVPQYPSYRAEPSLQQMYMDALRNYEADKRSRQISKAYETRTLSPEDRAYFQEAAYEVTPEEQQAIMADFYRRGLGRSRVAESAQQEYLLSKVPGTETLSTAQRRGLRQQINPRTMTLAGGVGRFFDEGAGGLGASYKNIYRFGGQTFRPETYSEYMGRVKSQYGGGGA